MHAPRKHYENPAGIVSRAWGRAPVPVYIRFTKVHDWFYRKNRNLLPLSYGEVWAAQICIGAKMHISRLKRMCSTLSTHDIMHAIKTAKCH